MRQRYIWLAVVVVLFVGLVPASAQLGVGSALSFFIYADSKSETPAGRLTIWFVADTEKCERTYWYTGSSRNILVPGNDPALRYCIARVDLQGKCTDKPVESTWPTLASGNKENPSYLFVAEVGKGEQEARFWFKGKKKSFLHILFANIPTGSKSIVAEESFRLFIQSDAGMSDYKVQLGNARNDWPLLSQKSIELYARTWVFEHWYQAQGLVPAGTKLRPVVSTASLIPLFEREQRQAAETAAQKREQEEQDLRDKEELARLRTQTTGTAGAAPGAITSPTAPETFGWKLVLPAGRWKITCGGYPYPGFYSGTVAFANGSAGVMTIQLESPNGTVLKPRRLAIDANTATAVYSTLQEVR